jgi:lipid-A-disaccharide synthase-like uncharacterized protein
MSDTLVFGVGFLAQILFSARLLVQWIKSEKAGRVLSPTLFWQLSLIASFLLMTYGLLRDDPVIILGQALSYSIYIRNLQYKKAWKLIPMHFKILVIGFPLMAIFWLSSSYAHNWNDVLNNKNISAFMLTWGSIGQVVFTFRFVYQWYFSEKIKKSILPNGFWIISLVGSLLIISYGVYRNDPVLILGQTFGIIIYSRNLYISLRRKKD